MSMLTCQNARHQADCLRSSLIAFAVALIAGIILIGAKEQSLNAAPLRSSGDAKADLQKLQGSWEATESWYANGKKWPDEILKLYSLMIMSEKMSISKKGGEGPVWTVKLDPSQTPKTIDCTLTNEGQFKDSVTLGIYELNGDTLKLAMGSASQSNRPKGFETGMGWGVTIWKRTKVQP